MIDAKWAWDVYKPSAESPWDLRRAGHLYRRAGFGANWTQLHAAITKDPHECVGELLKGGEGGPDWPDSIRKGNVGEQIPAWWLKRCLETGDPLREKLTIFWHNHFATSNAKVNNAGYMLGMIRLLHKHALGNFATLLQDITLDPAMLVWLDTNASKKGMPNENYARELMELFSLGIGHYSEQDIREAARGLTGYEINEGKTSLNRAKHDDSPKSVLGQTGRFKADDIVGICLQQKSCPYFVAGKLFRFLISESLTPDDELLAPVADEFRKSNYDIRTLVERMLRSNLFFSNHAIRTRVKSPVDFAVGIVRALEGNVSASGLAQALDGLGQKLGYPPSVKGWDGGSAWLNGQTLLFRQNLALALTSTEDDRFKSRTDPAKLVRRYAQESGEKPIDFFLKLFLQNDVPPGTRERLVNYLGKVRQQKSPVYWTEDQSADHPLRAVCHLVLTLPEFQLD